MDYNLPEKNGMDLIREIRAFNQDSQIIMITAYASLGAIMEAMQESVYDFLMKPVDFDYLKRTINRALDKYFLEESNRELLAELKTRNEDLDRLNNMKSKFFSMVSHDLSNSLMTLKMSFDMFRKKFTPTEEQQQKMMFMNESIGQIEHLIKDLVDWAAIEKGKLRIEKSPFELTESLKKTAEIFKDKAAKHNIQVSFESVGEIPVVADEKRIRQVISNLLENAVRHTPDNGTIEIVVSKIDEKNAKVSVRDSGDGIDPAAAPSLFTSFMQVGTKDRVGRLGLGLSIAKEIVVNHGGRIWAQSDGLGKGAAFNFTLPIAGV
jgi:signal transduction histidine kinase